MSWIFWYDCNQHRKQTQKTGEKRWWMLNQHSDNKNIGSLFPEKSLFSDTCKAACTACAPRHTETAPVSWTCRRLKAWKIVMYCWTLCLHSWMLGTGSYMDLNIGTLFFLCVCADAHLVCLFMSHWVKYTLTYTHLAKHSRLLQLLAHNTHRQT